MKTIRRYYDAVNKNESRDYEKESLEVNLSSIVLLPGMEEKRPSVEVGFHSFLKKNVIHSHSVYANVLSCSEEGGEAAQKIFAGSGIRHLFLPYIDPGFALTLSIKEAAEDYERSSGEMPNVLFLNNHGVIVHSPDADEAIAIHEKVNDTIRSYFSLAAFPSPAVKAATDGFAGDTAFLREFIAKNKAGEAYWNALKVYPDQLVYTAGKLGSAIKIDPDTGEINYRTSEKEAKTIEEILTGVAYVVSSIRGAGLTLRQMDEEGARFINNWESEKYRSKLVK